MTSEQLNGIVRSGLAFIGGIAVAKGWIDSQTMMTLVGALAPVIAAVWSVSAKRKTA
jgi:hypothetical protein